MNLFSGQIKRVSKGFHPLLHLHALNANNIVNIQYLLIAIAIDYYVLIKIALAAEVTCFTERAVWESL